MSKENPTTAEKMGTRNKEKNEALKAKFKDMEKNETGKAGATPEEFNKEDWERIEELAYHIFKHRMAGDDPKARDWQKKIAKEYGEDENAFQKEAIEEILKEKNISQWGPEAEEYMRKWDWAKAIEIYKRKKDEWHGKEDKGKPVAETVARPAAETTPAVPARVSSASPEVPPAATPVPTAQEIERERELAEIETARKELLLAENAYAKLYGETKARQNLIGRALGLGIEHEVNQDLLDLRKAYAKARDRYDQAKFDFIQKNFSGDEAKQKLDELKFEIFTKHDLDIQQKKDQHRAHFDENKKGLSGKVMRGWNKFSDAVNKLSWKKRLLIYGGLFLAGPGIAAAGYLTMRVIGGISSGKGIENLAKMGSGWIRGKVGKSRSGQIDRIMLRENIDINERYNLAKEKISKLNAGLEKRFDRMESGDLARRWLGVFTGIIVGSGVIASYIRETVGNYFEGGKGGVTTPEGAGKGILKPEIMETRPHGHVINRGESIWKVTRDIYMENPDGYDYKPSDPKIEKLYQSFRRQGILGKLGIESNDFSDLTNEEKLKIWAENKTANSIAKSKNIFNLVHAGDTVTVNPDGTIVFNEASGIKAGNLHDVQRPRGAGAYEPQGRKPAWLEALDEKQRAAQAKFAEAASVSDRTHEALIQSRGAYAAASGVADAAVDNVKTHEWMNHIQEKIYGKGTSVDWQQPAREFRKKFLGSFITSDQPMGPPANVSEQQSYWRAAQELNRRLGPEIGNETTEQWLQRGLSQGKISPEDMVQTLNRVVNQ